VPYFTVKLVRYTVYITVNNDIYPRVNWPIPLTLLVGMLPIILNRMTHSIYFVNTLTLKALKRNTLNI